MFPILKKFSAGGVSQKFIYQCVTYGGNMQLYVEKCVRSDWRTEIRHNNGKHIFDMF